MRMDKLDFFMYTFFAVMILLLGLCFYGLYVENKECNGRGGKMVGTGEYYPMTTIVGSTVIVQQVEETICTK